MIRELIPLSLILIGFGGALIFLIKKTQSVSDEEIERLIQQSRVIEKLTQFYQEKVLSRFKPQLIETKVLLLLEKFLRWLKVLTLKTENWLTGKIMRIKELRERPQFDPYYWLFLRKSALKKKIEETFSKKALSASIDPLREELRLIKKRAVKLDQWVHLVRFYLEKGELSEARRLLAKIWLEGEKSERFSLLLEELSLKVQEAELKEKVEKKQEISDNTSGTQKN